jgi:hypothetical protein
VPSTVLPDVCQLISSETISPLVRKPEIRFTIIDVKRQGAVLALAMVLAGLLLVSPPSFSAQYLYRYLNEEGVTVMDHSIPPEFTKRGYEILNPDGTVFKVVPRALTPDELANRSSEDYQAQVDAEEAERIAKWDKSLMLRYSTIEDIEAARGRALSELRIRIRILRGKVNILKQRVQTNQLRAANIERGGGAVPVAVVEAITALQAEIAVTERAIVEREREVEVVDQGFQRDVDRFTLLLDKVERRRRYSRTPD